MNYKALAVAIGIVSGAALLITILSVLGIFWQTLMILALLGLFSLLVAFVYFMALPISWKHPTGPKGMAIMRAGVYDGLHNSWNTRKGGDSYRNNEESSSPSINLYRVSYIHGESKRNLHMRRAHHAWR